ncbi:uncharacterized protein LOC135332981 [Halichondria panicea]|uniref:uncharacterized protein LOC135332981 n=1 Tax=Halichondria panicea TaxID=6063 RepID=UPI00312B3BFD
MEAEKSTTVTNQGQNVKYSVAGATGVTVNARLIIQQANIIIPEIPTLQDHQKAAKKQSQEWVDNIWPPLINTTAEIIDYANTFQATYDVLLELVPRLRAGDVDARDEFVQALKGALIPELQSKLFKANKLATSTKQFHDGFEPLYNEFQKDFTEAIKVMTKDNTKIQEDQASLVEWKTKADLEIFAILAFGISLPVTVVATALLSETGVGVLIGGIIIVGELIAIGVLLAEYAEAMKNVNDLITAIKEMKSEVAQLHLIEGQISGLQKNTEKVVAYSANVADGWLALSDDMKETIGHLQSISPQQAAIYIEINLKAANKDWGVVLQQAKNLQPKGGQLEQKIYATSDEMVKAIQAQAKNG